MPLHGQRLRARGFNQASVIAQALSKTLGLPLDEVSLLRVSGTEKYRAGLDAKGRRDTVAGAFKVRYPQLVQNEDILLVDDVFTTGATVSACAEALLSALTDILVQVVRHTGPDRVRIAVRDRPAVLGPVVGGVLLDPIKTTNVQNLRAMTTWVVRKRR